MQVDTVKVSKFAGSRRVLTSEVELIGNRTFSNEWSTLKYVRRLEQEGRRRMSLVGRDVRDVAASAE